MKYTEETLQYFARRDKAQLDYFLKHSRETKRTYKVGDLYICCIAREYDEHLLRHGEENSYGIQVWEDAEMENPESCIANQWFSDKDSANAFFKTVSAMAKV